MLALAKKINWAYKLERFTTLVTRVILQIKALKESNDTHIDVLEVIGIVLFAIIERRQVAEATTLKQQE